MGKQGVYMSKMLDNYNQLTHSEKEPTFSDEDCPQIRLLAWDLQERVVLSSTNSDSASRQLTPVAHVHQYEAHIHYHVEGEERVLSQSEQREAKNYLTQICCHKEILIV